MIDSVLNSIVDLIPSTADISNAIGSVIGTTLNNTLGRALYFIVSLVNWFISVVFQLFEVFSGQIKVVYKGEANYLTNIFFENSAISGIYWGMAIIGVVLCFAFTLIAVARKMFDGSDKVQGSLGSILGSMFKSILIILSLNISMVVVLNFSNVLMQRLVYVFNAGSSLVDSQSIDFTEDQYATMGRVLNTIGNYSLNPSYNSRYNLNSCFNEIRGDMLYLQDQGVFEFYYVTKDANGNEVETWQSALQSLVFAANLEEELNMDVYDEGVANTLLDIMNTLNTNTNFYPLSHYERSPAPLGNIPFDRVLFLSCTYNAAVNDRYNLKPSHTDALRGPYYNGEKSIYDVVQVSEDFNLLWGFNYIIFFLCVWGILNEMRYILMDCVARIYNMIMLYLVGPPFIALSPLDGGAKMKQWMTGFVVQCFGVFGTVVSMRLLLTFAPIIISTDLEIFSNAAMDIAAKVLMIEAGCLASRKASGIFTGILADSAGFQSITAGSLRADYDAKKQREKQEQQQKQQEKQQAMQQKQQKQAEKAQKQAQKQAQQQQKQKQQQNPKDQQKQQTPPDPKDPQKQQTPPDPKDPQKQQNPQDQQPPKDQQNLNNPQDQQNQEEQPPANGSGNGNGAGTPLTGASALFGVPVAPDISNTPHHDPNAPAAKPKPKAPAGGGGGLPGGGGPPRGGGAPNGGTQTGPVGTNTQTGPVGSTQTNPVGGNTQANPVGGNTQANPVGNTQTNPVGGNTQTVPNLGQEPTKEVPPMRDTQTTGVNDTVPPPNQFHNLGGDLGGNFAQADTTVNTGGDVGGFGADPVIHNYNTGNNFEAQPQYQAQPQHEPEVIRQPPPPQGQQEQPAQQPQQDQQPQPNNNP